MAEHNTLYQRAIYYDIVFDRDVSREVDFVAAAYRRYAGRELSSVLDIACGPGYHAREFARRGVHALGLDLRPEMIQFARDKDAAEGLALDWLVADMRSFHLDTAVDAAIVMFDSIDALTADDDYIRHFQTMADNLTARGLYIVDLTHPRDCSTAGYGSFHYSGTRNGTSVNILWGTNQPRFDILTGIADVAVEMRVIDQGQEIVIHDSARERFLTPQEISLLVRLSGRFEIAGWFGDYNLDQPLDDSPASRRMIVVLQNRS